MTTSEYKPTEDEERFLRYYEKLIRETINALAHLGLWERLENFTSNYLDELNHAPLFFRFTIKSHFDGHIFGFDLLFLSLVITTLINLLSGFIHLL